MAKINEAVGIRSLQTHIEDMRSLTLCKICLRPFYEPYILGCGHTYCYSCLRSWFGGSSTRNRNRNCPDCRTTVTIIPAPNYLLRDLAHLFVGRAELLPEDETVADHDRDRAAEAQMLSKDREGAGLFQGVFKMQTLLPITGMERPIRDLDDGVFRCPSCAWELEDGECYRCGWAPTDDEDVDFSGQEEEEEDGLASGSSAASVALSDLRPNETPHFYGVETESEDGQSSDRFGGSQPDQYDEHDDFIDNEVDEDVDDMEGAEFDAYPTDPATPYSDTTSYAEDDQQEDYGRARAAMHNSHQPTRHRVIHDSDDEEPTAQVWASDEDVPTAPPTRRRRPIAVSDDEEEDHPEDREFTDEDTDADIVAHFGRRRRARERIRQARQDAAEDEETSDGSQLSESTSSSESEAGTNSDSATGSESQSESAQESRPKPRSQSTRESTTDDSDDTIGPPQSIRDRRKRLQHQRDRRTSSRPTIDLRSAPPRNYGNGRRNRTTPVYS